MTRWLVSLKMQKELTDLVFDVLKEYSGTVIQQETVEVLLRTEDNICEENQQIYSHCSDKVNNSPSIHNGYPEYPLYSKLSRTLSKWMEHGKSVLSSEKPYLELPEKDDSPIKEVCNLVDLKLTFLRESWNNISISQKKAIIEEILETLQLRGILNLIGMRQTTGSVDNLPPPISSLWESFEVKHKTGANLSCGARALSKHCHRDSTSQWWGISTGSEHDKNEHASAVVEKILGDAVWINIHLLPHDVKVLEIRNKLGYGARWSHDGKTFRGFLEPQMHDGHSVGWRH